MHLVSKLGRMESWTCGLVAIAPNTVYQSHQLHPTSFFPHTDHLNVRQSHLPINLTSHGGGVGEGEMLDRIHRCVCQKVS